MIYVEILGRMGNQMFSYAHARYLQERYPEQEIALDFTNYRNIDETWINYLQYFECADNLKVDQRRMNITQKIMLKLFYSSRTKWKGYKEIYAHELRWARVMEWFDLYIFTNGYFPFHYKNHFKNKLLIGFFESERYFSAIRPILKKEFMVKDFEKNIFATEIAKRINTENCICVGVRRGDFISAENKKYCDLCRPQYFEEGVRKIKEYVERKELRTTVRKWTIYIFTEDISWAQNHLHFEDDVIYITSAVNGKLKPWEMLHIMTLFQYYVIPNSSFFWWGQFLSKAEKPVVVAPKVWRKADENVYQDIYEENWILLDPVN